MLTKTQLTTLKTLVERGYAIKERYQQTWHTTMYDEEIHHLKQLEQALEIELEKITAPINPHLNQE